MLRYFETIYIFFVLWEIKPLWVVFSRMPIPQFLRLLPQQVQEIYCFSSIKMWARKIETLYLFLSPCDLHKASDVIQSRSISVAQILLSHPPTNFFTHITAVHPKSSQGSLTSFHIYEYHCRPLLKFIVITQIYFTLNNKGRNGTSHGHPGSYFQHIPAHSSLFQPIVAYFSQIQPITAYYSLLQPVLAYTSLF